MRLPWRLFCLSLAPLALAACKGEQKPAEAKTAQGEILPGSASDAMLPLDTVRSQPPLAPVEVASGRPGSKAAPGAAASDKAGTEAGGSAEKAPAAAPSIAADPVD